MGTFDASKIVTARKDYPCGDARHTGTIRKGEQYLSYALGLKWTQKVCLHCATYTENGKPRYRCAAVLERLSTR